MKLSCPFYHLSSNLNHNATCGTTNFGKEKLHPVQPGPSVASRLALSVALNTLNATNLAEALASKSTALRQEQRSFILNIRKTIRRIVSLESTNTMRLITMMIENRKILMTLKTLMSRGMMKIGLMNKLLRL